MRLLVDLSRYPHMIGKDEQLVVPSNRNTPPASDARVV